MTATVPPETRRRFRLPWWAWTLTAIAVVAGIVALLGGFADVPIEKLPKIELGESIDGNEVRATIDDVYLAPTAPVSGTEAGQDDDGNDLQYLVVDATLENLTHATSSFSYDVVRVLLGDEIAVTDDPYNLLELRSGDSFSDLQPGLPTRVAFLWKVPLDRISAGDDVIVGVFVRNPLRGDPVFGDDAFSAPTPIARIVTTIGGCTVNRRTIASGMGAIAMVALAALAVSTAPNDTTIVEAFPVTADVGQLATARLVSAEVHEVRLVQELDVAYGFDEVDGSTDGVWVVVDATITANIAPTGTGYTELRIGDYLFRASEILPAPALTDVRYGAGVPVTGALVFEVPASVLALPGAAHASITIRNLLTPQLDTVPVIRLDLSGLTIERFATIGAAFVGDETDAGE